MALFTATCDPIALVLKELGVGWPEKSLPGCRVSFLSALGFAKSEVRAAQRGSAYSCSPSDNLAPPIR